MSTIKKGSITDRGKVEKIVYLTFIGTTGGSYSNKAKPGGKGLICAKISNKTIPVGELKLIK